MQLAINQEIAIEWFRVFINSAVLDALFFYSYAGFWVGYNEEGM